MDSDGNQYDISSARYSENLPRSARMLVLAGVLLMHGAVAWGLMQITEVRQAVLEAAPLFVRWVAPPAPEVAVAVAPPEPEPPPPEPEKPKPKPKPKPIVQKPPKVVEKVVVEEPSSEPEPEVMISAPAQSSAPATNFTAAEPVAVQVSAPPPRPEPRVIEASAVRYREKPNPIYPQRSLRFGEEGNVLVRVLIDEKGNAVDIVLACSSGISRLDEAAMEAVKRARFYPYKENGVAISVWAQVPISFTLKRR